MATSILLVDDNESLGRLLSKLFGEAGYHVVSVQNGQQALQTVNRTTPSFAVIDLLLPDMTGYSLCEQLKARFPGLAVVFISGAFKGEKFHHEAKQKYGILQYFEKPFDARKLLQLVKTTCPPQFETKPQEVVTARAEELFQRDFANDVDGDEPLSPMELTGRIRVQGHGVLEHEGLVTATPPPLPMQVPFQSNVLVSPPHEEPMSFAHEGELANNLPNLMTAFYTLKETGELLLQKGAVKKAVFFEKGIPVFALSNLASDRFGAFLVRVGKLAEGVHLEVAKEAKLTGRRTGDILISRGQLRESERLFYVAQQVKAIIYSLFAWETGNYSVTFRASAHAEPIKLDVHPGNLIIRGIKKLYKPERMKRIVALEMRPHLSTNCPYSVSELEADKWEQEVWQKLDGRRTVAEVMAASPKPEHQVLCAVCIGLALEALVMS